MRSHVCTISAATLAEAPGWAPSFFTGPAAVALGAGRFGSTVSQLGGIVVEGWRVSDTPGTNAYDPRAAETPIYRQSNIGRLRILLSDQHWQAPTDAERWCVRPGDVVLNKLAPVKAAIVSTSSHRHPVDGNSLIVRGLPRATATWLAVCLNRPEYEALLLVQSGVLRRVGISSLANLRLPPVPAPVDVLADLLWELLDSMLMVDESLHRLRLDAENTAVAPVYPRTLREGRFFEQGALSNESWSPRAVALRSEHVELAQNLQWTALRDLAHAEYRGRLRSLLEGARALRLSDVGDDLFVAAREDGSASLAPTGARTLDKPLVAGEVLLSTLGTSFRAAYVDEAVPQNTFPTDGWVRLRFRETPAAWALLLSTAHVRQQTARLAIGSVQQFVPPEALLSIHVPTPQREMRERWQGAVARHHAQRRVLDRRWSVLSSALVEAFHDAHRPSASDVISRHEVLQ